MRPDEYSVEDIQSIFVETCERLYGAMNHRGYFKVVNKKEKEVAREILTALDNQELAKMKYLDMSLYVLQTGDDVFISIA